MDFPMISEMEISKDSISNFQATGKKASLWIVPLYIATGKMPG
jgi:hypothetical protein